MSMKINYQTGYLDGSKSLYAAGTDFVAGQPARLTSNGLELALNPEDVIGLFANDMVKELAVGPQAADALAAGFEKATYLAGFNEVTLEPGKLQNGTAALPFKFPGTAGAWAAGQRLFLAADGKWDNQPAAANDPPFGVCLKAPASDKDTLEAQMNTANGLLYSAIAT